MNMSRQLDTELILGNYSAAGLCRDSAEAERDLTCGGLIEDTSSGGGLAFPRDAWLLSWTLGPF